MIIDKNNLPPSWTIAKFEDLLDYIQPTEYIVASTDYDDKYKTPVLTAGKSFIKGYTKETNGIFNAVPVIIFDDFTTATQFVNFPFKVKSSAMKILKPTSELVNIKLAFYFMQTVHLKSETHKRYWISEYSKLPIPLPPEKEQQRIFDKIEELITDLDKGIEYLETAQQQLKVYRQAVLKWAFEGRLTNKKIIDGELPKDWKQVSLESISKAFGGYAFKSTSFKKSGSHQVLRIGNVRPGIVRVDESPVFIDASEQEIKKAKLKIDDVIITLTGTKGKRDYGFTTLIKQDNFLLNQRIAAIRFENKTTAKYFLYFSWTNIFKNQFFESETGNVGQGNVGMKGVTKVLVPLCSPKEQEKIILEIESRLSVCDKIEEAIEDSLLKAEALRLSIIKKGFEGKLTKQNPKDELAEILLTKIRAEIKKNNPDKPKKEVKIKTSKKKKELA